MVDESAVTVVKRRLATLNREAIVKGGSLSQYHSESALAKSLLSLGPLAAKMNQLLRFTDYSKLKDSHSQNMRALQEDCRTLFEELFGEVDVSELKQQHAAADVFSKLHFAFTDVSAIDPKD